MCLLGSDEQSVNLPLQSMWTFLPCSAVCIVKSLITLTFYSGETIPTDREERQPKGGELIVGAKRR